MEIETVTPDKPEVEEIGFLQMFVFASLFIFIGAFVSTLIFGSNAIPGFMMTDGYCDELMLESNNESFINGTMFGQEYTATWISNEALQCNPIPITYQNYSYTLIAAECLNLNETQEVK